MTDSAALLKRKYMIVKFSIDREFIAFFIQKLKLTLLRKCLLMASFQEDSFESFLL